MSETRTEMTTIRLTKEEHARAEAVAKYHGVNVASLFRMLIKKEARDIGGGEDIVAPKVGDLESRPRSKK